MLLNILWRVEISCEEQIFAQQLRDGIGCVVKFVWMDVKFVWMDHEPFIDDHFSRLLRRTVRSYCKDVKVVFVTGASLKDRLVSSSLDRPVCPKKLYRRKKKGRGRPVE